jgi:hypothetical protein
MRAPSLIAAALLAALALLLLPSTTAGGEGCDGGYPGQAEWIEVRLHDEQRLDPLAPLLLPASTAGGEGCDGGYPGQTEWIKALLIVEPGIEETYAFRPSEVQRMLTLLNPGPFPTVVNADTVLVYSSDKRPYEYLAAFHSGCMVFSYRQKAGWHTRFLLPEIGT